MSACATCAHGEITLHSATDRCLSANNTNGYPPYALRHDEALCGTAGAWFAQKLAPATVYKADSMSTDAKPAAAKI